MDVLTSDFAVFRAVPSLLRELERVDARAASTALRYGRAPLLKLPRGLWAHRELAPDGLLGLLVIDGMILRNLRTCGTQGSQLIGPGDLFRPWDLGPDRSSIPCETSWTVSTPARCVLLDRRFAHVMSRWPEVTVALLARLAHSAQSLALQVAIARLAQLDHRLYVLLSHLADRWGEADADGGVTLTLRLSHDEIARMVGAARPSVSRRLTAMLRAGAIARRQDGSWVLRLSRDSDALPSPVHRAAA